MIKQKHFEITEQHLRLIQHMNVEFEDQMYYGAPAIDIKRPYGNKSVVHDIGRILNIPPNTLKEDTYGDDYMSYDQQTERNLLSLHEQTTTALQICLQLMKFETGLYETFGAFHSQWEKVNER